MYKFPEIFKNKFFILAEDGQTPIATTEIAEWCEWMQDPTLRVVRADKIHGVYISTVFLGVDHFHEPGEPPVLWETMTSTTFTDDHELNGRIWRYQSYAEAIAGHQKICKLVFSYLAT